MNIWNKKNKSNAILISILGLVIVPILLTLIGYLISYIFNSKYSLCSPFSIWHEVLNQLFSKEIWIALLWTFIDVFAATFIALFVGVLVGYILGYSDNVWRLAQPSVDFFRSIPVTFLIPLSMIVIGGSPGWMRVTLLTIYPAILIMIFQIRSGVAIQNKIRLHSFYILSGNTSKYKSFFNVTIRETLPEILTGIRLILSYSIVIVTVLEFSSFGQADGRQGIGYKIMQQVYAQNLTDPQVYAYTFVIGMLGYVLNKSLEHFQFKIIHWAKKNNID